MCFLVFINNKAALNQTSRLILAFYLSFLKKKQTFTTEITAIYKLQQQTQLSILNTRLSSALTVIIQPVKQPATPSQVKFPQTELWLQSGALKYTVWCFSVTLKGKKQLQSAAVKRPSLTQSSLLRRQKLNSHILKKLFFNSKLPSLTRYFHTKRVWRRRFGLLFGSRVPGCSRERTHWSLIIIVWFNFCNTRPTTHR